MLKTTDTGQIYNIKEQLNGWNYVLDHKLYKNDFTDVYTINAPPDLDHTQPED